MTLFSSLAFGGERKYELNVEHVTKNITGVDVTHALAINGSIPAPTLRFKVGDTAVIKVVNKTTEPTTLHWHGLLLPWDQDGPSFSNTKLILPGTSHTFKFPIIHSGTFWYHSHTELQEQRGLYGAIVIEDEKEIAKVDHDLVFLMSDWTNERPMQVLKNLKKDGDYYALKKKFLPSVLGAIRAGVVWDYIKAEWTRMGPMDLSDVGYDAFLINGKQKEMLKNIKHGEKVRLRVINASASTYFYFNIGNLRNFKVITKDGIEVMPVEVNELRVAIAETYDIVFTMPHEMKTFEIKATAQDITGSASWMVGNGPMEHVPMKMKPSPYGMGDMDHGGGGHGDHDDGGDDGGGHGDHDDGGDNGDEDDDFDNDDFGDEDESDGGHDNHLIGKKEVESQMEDDLMFAEMEEGNGMPMPPMKKTKRLTYDMLMAKKITAFDPELPTREITLELSGDMDRYTWHINGKPFSEEKYIMIKYGEVVKIKFVNKTMMHHPMHLHGHFFRVINKMGKKSPLMHTVDVAPMQTVDIEFYANEPGIWFLHCHNLYHMKMGMARLVKYEGFERPDDLIQQEMEWGPRLTHDNDAFGRGEVFLGSNNVEVNLGINAGRYEVELNIEIDEYDIDNLEADLLFKRYFSRFLAGVIGAEYDENSIYGLLGVQYMLPLNVEMLGYVRTDGKVIVKLRKEIPLTSRLALELEPTIEYLSNEIEFGMEAGLNYVINERWEAGITYGYDEQEGHRVGFGIRFKF
tara:strand:- start:96153 stop:98381 length:2229 start_codon:yes stop_codon:yes gene_type:complete